MEKYVKPKLEVGDRVILLRMEDKYASVRVGSKGTVTNVTEVFGEPLYSVDWDNGSKLAIVPSVDIYMKDTKDNNVQESIINVKTDKEKIIPSLNSIFKDKVFTVDGDELISGLDVVVKYKVHFIGFKPMISVGEWYDYLMCDVKIKVEGPTQELVDLITNILTSDDQYHVGFKFKKFISQTQIAKKTKYFGFDRVLVNNVVTNQDTLKEQFDFKTLTKHKKMFDAMNLKVVMKFLVELQKSGLTNMLGAAPYLMLGKEGIIKELNYHKDGTEGFEDLIESASDCRNEIISGAMKILEDEGKEITLSNVESKTKTISRAIMELYIRNYKLMTSK
jgi:hypothetical protein